MRSPLIREGGLVPGATLSACCRLLETVIDANMGDLAISPSPA